MQTIIPELHRVHSASIIFKAEGNLHGEYFHMTLTFDYKVTRVTVY